LIIVVLMLAYVLKLRTRLLVRERRHRDLSATWTPILLNGAARYLRRLRTTRLTVGGRRAVAAAFTVSIRFRTKTPLIPWATTCWGR
jgi:hypothetical protein